MALRHYKTGLLIFVMQLKTAAGCENIPPMIILPAPFYLQSCIDFFWYTGGDAAASQAKVKLIPDGKHGLIIQHNNGRPAIRTDNGDLLPVAFVYGQSSAPFINYLQGPVQVMGVFFKTHALKDIFKIDADKLADGFADLDDLCGKGTTDMLLNLADPQAIAQYLSKLFWEKLNSYNKHDRLIEDSMTTIQQHITDVTTERIYNAYPISRRQFQRRFKERAGIQLGTYIRVLKFQRSLQLLHDKRFARRSDIAYSLGYADQSHFIRDFKNFTGYTPGDVQNNAIIIPENAFAHPLLQTRRHIYF